MAMHGLLGRTTTGFGRRGAALLHFFPDDVFVVSAVVERIHFTGSVAMENEAAFHAFAEEHVA